MISKTDFMLFLEASMHLWARAHNLTQIKLNTPYEQHLIQQGQQVEKLAKNYIETFLLPDYSEAELIWQPTYNDGQFEARADAIIWDKTSDVHDLYEIKSATSVHRDHEYDVTFQVLVLEEFLKLRRKFILHINKHYQQGNTFNLENFFTADEISEQVEKRRLTVTQLRQAAHEIAGLAEPDSNFACTKPSICPCPALCHPKLSDHPIYDIPYIGKKALQLRDMGIVDVKSIPPSFKLNGKQIKHVQAVKANKPLIELQAIKDVLSNLEYPLYFLDYETFNPAVPLYPDYHPYEHIVFQYSLHVKTHPHAELQHFDCLITDKRDPAPLIASQLLKHLGSSGSVIVWNQHFEAQRNRELALHCPKYSKHFENINDRLFDLMLIFKDGLYVHPDFHGSSSLKAVLPVLCPDLSYEKLAVSNGEEAMLTWYLIQTGELSSEALAETADGMKAYCKLDTYAMVAILHHLQDLLKDDV